MIDFICKSVLVLRMSCFHGLFPLFPLVILIVLYMPTFYISSVLDWIQLHLAILMSLI